MIEVSSDFLDFYENSQKYTAKFQGPEQELAKKAEACLSQSFVNNVCTPAIQKFSVVGFHFTYKPRRDVLP